MGDRIYKEMNNLYKAVNDNSLKNSKKTEKK